MLRCALAWALCVVCLPAHALSPEAANQRPVLVTGEVIALDAQQILVPPSDSSPVVLRRFVPEGTTVVKGDLLLQIDPGAQGAQLSELESQARQAAAKAEREAAELEVKSIEAEQALAGADAALAKALLDAALPRIHLAAIDYDRYQGEAERATRDREVKRAAWKAALDAVERRREDGRLEVDKLALGLAFARAQIQASSVFADTDGTVVHGFNEWRGRRYEEGESGYPGNIVGQVIGTSRVGVRAWALESDRPHLKEQQAVRLSFDAVPGEAVEAQIASIGMTPEARASWGPGRYFRVDVALPPSLPVTLKPGMSALLEATTTSAAAAFGTGTEPLRPLTLEGELVSQRSEPIAPPSVEGIWTYTLAMLAPEGTLVAPGEPVAVFDAPDIQTRLEGKRSMLKEKRSQGDKLNLDQAQTARSDELAVSEARSKAEKAARKATQPREMIGRIAYDKLVIERELAGREAELAQRRQSAAARARAAELAQTQAEIDELSSAVAQLELASRSLAVGASKAGVVLHRTQFNGEKFAVGSQVWAGLAAAEVADPEQLVVRATVPEQRADSVAAGQRARVTVAGANLVLDAYVREVGRQFHSKSRTQPVIVLDVVLEFAAPPKGVKPGAAVQVRLLEQPAAGAVGAQASE